MPLLTVGLPVRNAMPYLRQTMECLLNQSSREFKILAVVDDCDDGSLEYLASINDDRLRLVVHTGHDPKTVHLHKGRVA